MAFRCTASLLKFNAVLLLIIGLLYCQNKYHGVSSFANWNISAQHRLHESQFEAEQTYIDIHTNYSTNYSFTKIANLINNKYNDTKLLQNMHLLQAHKYFIRLPEQYSSHIRRRNMQTNIRYELPDNVSFIIRNAFSMGIRSRVYNVSILYNNISHHDSESYVLKIYREKHSKHYKKEYTVFKTIENYIQYYNLSSQSFNMPFIHPTIPPYQSNGYFFIFNTKINNPMKWYDVLTDAETLLPSIIATKGSILNFLIDCYDDIMKVFHMFYDLGMFHNDLSPGNVLVNTKTWKCYVIDFGIIVKTKRTVLHPLTRPPPPVELTLKYHMEPKTSSPLGYYYLSDFILSKRVLANGSYMQNVMKIYGDTKVLCKFMLYSKEYEIAARIFHAFVKLYFLNRYKLFEQNEVMTKSLTKSERKDYDRKLFWCNRYELYRKIMKWFQIDHSDHDDELEPISNDTKLKFINIISIINNDLLFLNSQNCPYIRKLQSIFS